MAEGEDPVNLDSLSLSDTEVDDTQDLFVSPSKRQPNASKPPTRTTGTQKRPQSEPIESEEDAAVAHDAQLRQELQSLRAMNTVISGVNKSMDKARTNMDTVATTVNDASVLLTTWTRILSQTEHNQRLILNPNWQGASQDLIDIENEKTQRQQEVERRAMEEERRARQRQAEREEDERRRAVESSSGSRGTRGKYSARGTARSSGYAGTGGRGAARGTGRGSVVSRSSASAAKGSGAGRGRGRGV